MIAVESSGLFFHPSASGESNHPGATTFTVMPAGARSSASPLAMPTSPAFDALYAVSPLRGRSPRTEPVKISRPPVAHHPGRGAGAEERAGEVHLQDLPPDRRRRSRGGRPTIGEIPALQIHTSTPPHSATVASATASLKSSSVTSPLSTRDGPGSASATAFRSSLRAGDERHRRRRPCENAWASSAPSRGWRR